MAGFGFLDWTNRTGNGGAIMGEYFVLGNGLYREHGGSVRILGTIGLVACLDPRNEQFVIRPLTPDNATQIDLWGSPFPQVLIPSCQEWGVLEMFSIGHLHVRNGRHQVLLHTQRTEVEKLKIWTPRITLSIHITEIVPGPSILFLDGSAYTRL